MEFMRINKQAEKNEQLLSVALKEVKDAVTNVDSTL